MEYLAELSKKSNYKARQEEGRQGCHSERHISEKNEEKLRRFRELQKENQKLTDMISGIYAHLIDLKDLVDLQYSTYSKKQEDLREAKRKKMEDERMIVQNYNNGSSGHKVFITNDLWRVVIAIMTGIELSVRAFDYENKQYKVDVNGINMKNTFEINFPSSENFDVAQFIDFAPTMFNSLRKINGIFPEKYIESLGPEILSKVITTNIETFEGLGSSGQSGSFFFTTPDKRYLVKTISKEEFELFLKILQNYYEHLSKNNHSLIAKIYGLHKIRLKIKGKQTEWIIVVMQNIMCTSKEILAKYDLKGSTYKRKTKGFKKAGDSSKNSAPGKDLDFLEGNQPLKLSPKYYNETMKRLQTDCDFLSSQNIIDYSLLLGVHENKSRDGNLSPQTKTGNFFSNRTIIDNSNRGIPQADSTGTVIMREKISAEELAEREFYNLPSNDEKFIYFVGIIDILTPFNARKKAEYFFKSNFVNKNISCVPPRQYKDRFMSFMKDKVFKAEEAPPPAFHPINLNSLPLEDLKSPPEVTKSKFAPK